MLSVSRSRAPGATGSAPPSYRQRCVRLAAVGADDPAARAVAQHQLVTRLRGGPVLDLDVELVWLLLAGQQLLFERLPEGGVIDVVGEVALGRPEAPGHGV